MESTAIVVTGNTAGNLGRQAKRACMMFARRYLYGVMQMGLIAYGMVRSQVLTLEQWPYEGSLLSG